jgi:hypothetical protein
MYYERNFKDTHLRISCNELMDENEITFHKSILIIVKNLKNGKNVVIDDENNSSKTRKSLIEGIRKKMDKVEIRCIQFIPFGGISQVLWANQFSKSQKTFFKNGKLEKEYKDQLDEKILFEKYFNSSFSNPLQSEGFDSPIQQITTNLYANCSTNSSLCHLPSSSSLYHLPSSSSLFHQKALLIDSSQLFLFTPLTSSSQSQQQTPSLSFLLDSYQLIWRNKNIPNQISLFSQNFPEIR